MKESDLKRTVTEYLEYAQNLGKLVYLRLNSGDFIEVRGNTRRRIKGCQAGTADILVLTNNGRYDAPNKFYCIPIFLELKSEKGRTSPAQDAFKIIVEAQGCVYKIIRNMEDLQEILWGSISGLIISVD